MPRTKARPWQYAGSLTTILRTSDLGRTLTMGPVWSIIQGYSDHHSTVDPRSGHAHNCHVLVEPIAGHAWDATLHQYAPGTTTIVNTCTIQLLVANDHATVADEHYYVWCYIWNVTRSAAEGSSSSWRRWYPRATNQGELNANLTRVVKLATAKKMFAKHFTSKIKGQSWYIE